jgi:hypothetical protein
MARSTSTIVQAKAPRESLTSMAPWSCSSWSFGTCGRLIPRSKAGGKAPSGPWQEESKEDSQAARNAGLLVALDQSFTCRLVTTQPRSNSDVHLTCVVGGRGLALAPVFVMNGSVLDCAGRLYSSSVILSSCPRLDRRWNRHASSGHTISVSGAPGSFLSMTGWLPLRVILTRIHGRGWPRSAVVNGRARRSWASPTRSSMDRP